VPYLSDLIHANQFDTIYHEHQSYFAVTPLYHELPTFGLRLIGAQRVGAQGGSIRMYIGKLNKSKAPHADKLTTLIESEKGWLVDSITYEVFEGACQKVKKELNFLLKTLTSSRDTLGGYNTIVGHAASAKGSILLNYCGVGGDLISWVADSNTRKIGRCIPGVRIPIKSESELATLQPDYIVALSWNLMEDLKRVRTMHCPTAKIICPIPHPEVVNG
jgi:hypothetical protein